MATKTTYYVSDRPEVWIFVGIFFLTFFFLVFQQCWNKKKIQVSHGPLMDSSDPYSTVNHTPETMNHMGNGTSITVHGMPGVTTITTANVYSGGQQAMPLHTGAIINPSVNSNSGGNQAFQSSLPQSSYPLQSFTTYPDQNQSTTLSASYPDSYSEHTESNGVETAPYVDAMHQRI
jgi:hypothetical protein